MEFKPFAIELFSIKDFNNCIEKLSKMGYSENESWTEIMMESVNINWGVSSYLISTGDGFLELHNHDGDEQIITLNQIINNENNN